MSNDSLGDRMKGYEDVSRSRLVPKMPVLLRLDGKAFHTLTRGMNKPVDDGFQRCMWNTAITLCEEIQGVQVAYVQSDEITLLLVDYQSIQSQGWFGYQVQKMCSVAAGIASVTFSNWMRGEFIRDTANDYVAIFDCRAWNVPREEVVNAFIWRQQDATRNSIQGLAQAHFSHRELHLKDQPAMMDMLMLQKGINWNDCPIPQKRGVCIVKEAYEVDGVEWPNKERPTFSAEKVIRTRWIVDEAIPIFTQDRNYIQRFVDVDVPRADGGR